MFLHHILICVLVLLISKVECSSDKIVARARIESCPGCQLNRLHEVKKFIFEDIPKYKNVEFKKIPGAPPELVLLNENDEEMERIALKSRNRDECNELLRSKGFTIGENNEL